MISNAARLFVVAVVLLGCALTVRMNSFAAKQTTAQVGKEFSLKIGQQVKLDGVDLQVKFVGVPQDSRCPSNVTCVWAGNAEVALDLIDPKCTTILTLNTHIKSPTSDEAKVGDFRVKLVKLDPYPRSDQKISPSDYTATFLVTKESSANSSGN